MGEFIFFICKTCKETEWVTPSELIDRVNEHSGHRIYVLTRDILDDDEELEKWFRKFMEWEE